MKYGELTKVGRINYNKKVAIIYNPNSGKKRDVRKEITQILTNQVISYELRETTPAKRDAWRIA